MGRDIQLFESVMNKSITEALKKIEDDHKFHKDKIDPIDSTYILSKYFQTVLESALSHSPKTEYSDSSTSNSDITKRQIKIVNETITFLSKLLRNDDLLNNLVTEDYQLRGISNKLTTREKFFEMIPITSVSMNTLFTGNDHEPPVFKELKREIQSADKIDFLVSFIKHSGLRLILDDLIEFTKTKKLRIITTSYMGITDFKAIETLAKLPNTEVKISYDTSRTRLHAKAYFFQRDSGFSTAYIGSSNLSKAALSEGTEWNLKITEHSSPALIEKYQTTFETYWNMNDFQNFDPNSSDDLKKLKQALQEESNSYQQSAYDYFFDIIPFAYQQAALDKLQLEREFYKSYKNLIVAATGTGKTVISAFDFKTFYIENPNSKLLFLAHREEILRQSMFAYRGVLRNANFGELWVGESSPTSFDHVFASIQTLTSNDNFERFGKDYFDYIVIDETHHVAASSYRKIVDYFSPKILLGLTATPERNDNQNVLKDFNNRIAFEIRLREAIERNLLCPFHYFGVSDSTDISDVSWRNGVYDIAELNARYIGNNQRNNDIFDSINKYITSISSMKALGFCTSKEHARYMSEVFNKKGIPSVNLDSDSSHDLRKTARNDLISGKIKVIFTVDLYNEGIDIKEINTVLFLRPTESATIFIQQLGRGLRLHKDKDVLTVLDYVGQAHKKYDYRIKFQSLIGKTSSTISSEVMNGFLSLPSSCSIVLEKIAKERILRSIESSYINNNKLPIYVTNFRLNSEKTLNLVNFIEFYQLDLLDIYKYSTLSRLFYEELSLNPDSIFANRDNLKRSFAKIAKLNSVGLLRFLQGYIRDPRQTLSIIEERYATMFYYTIFNEPCEMGIEEFMVKISKDKSRYVEEMLAVIEYSLSKIDHLPKKLDINDEIPIELHASYSTTQVLAAVGINTIEEKKAFREGVKYVERYKLDLFFVTLNKSEKHFKESTRYTDYALSEDIFHWQSQNKTSTTSATGVRYLTQNENGSKVVIFVREKNSDEYGNTETFRCLGLANYESHKGSEPISISYKLKHKMPAEVFVSSNKVVKIT